jgi:hypothetical protein
MVTVNRLLSKFWHHDRDAAAQGNGLSHVRVVRGRAAEPRASYVMTAAETAPCTCPEFCERDHDNE